MNSDPNENGASVPVAIIYKKVKKRLKTID
ncbi:hypothetical protein PLUA15_290074 [Pseudomonas lundensis]|uniref:Uncharacterized protein n=1 Tax=Pseudomonas lundensis TaxID=86185 RepID=A0AAX2HA77_9PSED|nr:hypothetical protein PLUA15_290074 [Pseudomonas lundensis]